MTLQIGLVANDGLILASDTLMQNVEGAARSVGTVSKILRSSSGVICCWSGDSVAEQAANMVRQIRWEAVSEDSEAIRDELINCGERTLDDYRSHCKSTGQVIIESLPRKVLVACA